MVQQYPAACVAKATRITGRLAPLAVAAACLAACAGGPPDRPPEGGGPPGFEGPGRHGGAPDGGPHDEDRDPGLGLLFISPAGEPFRAELGQPYPVQAWFRQADANGDGALDRAEFEADAERFFHRLDRNGDGVLDGLEVQAYETQVVPEILRGPVTVGAIEPGRVVKADYQGPMGGGGMGGGGGGRGGGRHGGESGPPSGSGPAQKPLQGAAPYNFLAEPEPVTSADLDFNGRITLANFRRRADMRFDILDPDQTGRLTLDDLPKTAVEKSLGQGHRRRGGRRPPAS
jgi:hypothetical protein